MMRKLVVFTILFSILFSHVSEAAKRSRGGKTGKNHTHTHSNDECSDALRVKGITRHADGSTTRIIWGTWDCTSCRKEGISAEPAPGEKNAKCPECGSPREEHEQFELNNAVAANGKVLNANVADTAEEVRIATAGEDWECSYCRSANKAIHANCKQCTAPRYEPSPESFGGLKEGFSPETVELPKPIVRSPRRAERSLEDIDSHFQKSLKQNQRKRMGIIAAAVGAGALIVGGVTWALTTHKEVGEVSGMHWVHTVERQTFTQVTEEDWEDEISGESPIMPVNGRGERAGEFNAHSCHRAYRGEGPRYQCGTETYSEQVSEQVRTGESCTTSSNGNGSYSEHCTPTYTTRYHTENRTRPKYCTDPIYNDRCSYTTYQWQRVQVEHTSGGAPAPGTQSLTWPQISPGRLDRLVAQETYTIDVAYRDGGEAETFEITPESESQFLTWSPGDRVELDVRNFGGISEWRRIRGR